MSLDTSQITIIDPHAASQLARPRTAPQSDTRWLQFFSREQAIEDVYAHVLALPSSGTPEQYTLQVYSSGLKYFVEWIGDELPTESMLKKYIAHLKTKYNHKTKKPGLSSSTIASKYLAPVRLYLKSLSRQHIISDNMGYIMACKDQLRIAAEIKNPKPETKSGLSALYRYGVRLSVRQVNRLLSKIDRSDLVGKRDYALLLTAFYTGLRLAELQRMTLASISQENGAWIVTVRRKCSNYDPAAIPEVAVDAIMTYIDAYNDGLPENDHRRITNNTPIWQPLTRSGNYLKPNAKTGVDGDGIPVIYNAQKGMSNAGIGGIIRKRAGVAPHDTRRTMAANADRKGAPTSFISKQLGHASSVTTERYIGKLENYADWDMSRYFTIG